MMGTAKKALIFDADGTLYSVKTAKAYSRLYRFLSSRTGTPEREIKRRHALEVEKVKGSKNPAVRSHFHSISRLVPDLGLSKRAEAEFWKGLRVIKRPGARNVLEKLRRKGYRLAIASDEFYGRLAKKMELAIGKGWRKYFGCTVTPERTGVMKPSGRYYRVILGKFDIRPSEAVVVGNLWDKDLQPAARLGMVTVLIGNKKEGKPDFFIRRISDLVGILGKWER